MIELSLDSTIRALVLLGVILLLLFVVAVVVANLLHGGHHEKRLTPRSRSSKSTESTKHPNHW